MMKKKIFLLVAVLILVAFTIALNPLGVTNFGAVHIRDTNGTATPALMVDQRGSGKIFELKDGGTVVYSVNNGGEVIQTGGQALNNLVVSAPTAIGTATPAALINSAGVSNLLEVRDAATPQFSVNNGGNIDAYNNPIVNIGAAGTDFGGAGNLTTAEGITITTGGLTISDGNAVVADDFLVTAQTAISVTDGGVITPTGTYQPLESAGTVTPTIETSGFTAGTLLVLINTANTTINIADSGTAKLSAAAALGQYDSLTLWFDGTNWIELSVTDN